MSLRALSPNLYVFADTCRVYAVRSGDAAVLVDFGSGDVLDALGEAGIQRVTDVLVTHHHRDQVQGLARAAAAGARIWVPYAEQDLFDTVDRHWAARELYLNYNMRQNRFALLEPVQPDSLLEDYADYDFGGRRWQVRPTPGHTPGSLSLVVEIDGRLTAFCGDLLAAPGKLWSLAATQWSYNGGEGLPATLCSLLDLRERGCQALLPSHGEPIEPLGPAVEQTAARLGELMRARRQNPRLLQFLAEPYSAISPHLLRSRQSMANSYVLRSESGKALIIDFGYDFMTGLPVGSDRAGRRPWLYSLPALKRQYGITQIDVVLPTHYHDDHVAGINLLRRVEGTRSWVAESFALILANPARYDLPCLWYDPIPADHILPLGEPFEWQEYRLCLHPLPGHTHYAVAVEFEVDGVRALAVGDQHQNDDGVQWNYVYQNRFAPGDYRLTAELYRRLQPQLILSGHWEPLWVQPGYFDELAERGALLERLHRELLPAEIAGFGTEGFGARIEPYQSVLPAGQTGQFSAEIYNPTDQPAAAQASLILPPGWQAQPAAWQVKLPPLGSARLEFTLTPGAPAYRARIALDLSVGGRRFGQQAEALVSVSEAKSRG